MHDVDHATSLRFMGSAVKAAKLPYPERIAAIAATGIEGVGLEMWGLVVRSAGQDRPQISDRQQ